MTQITVTKATTSTAPKGYPVVELAYKSEDGKIKSLKVLGFGQQKAIADAFKNAQSGDVYDVSFEKNDRGYWQFKTATSTGQKATVEVQAESGKTSKASGNWETSEERAARQVYIVRQSCLERAIQYAVAVEPKGISKSPADMIDLAKIFEGFVFDKQPAGDVQ